MVVLGELFRPVPGSNRRTERALLRPSTFMKMSIRPSLLTSMPTTATPPKLEELVGLPMRMRKTSVSSAVVAVLLSSKAVYSAAWLASPTISVSAAPAWVSFTKSWLAPLKTAVQPVLPVNDMVAAESGVSRAAQPSNSTAIPRTKNDINPILIGSNRAHLEEKDRFGSHPSPACQRAHPAGSRFLGTVSHSAGFKSHQGHSCLFQTSFQGCFEGF